VSEHGALLERERELGVLANVLAEAQQGRGQLVLVRAPAGLGKTTLLNAASDTAGGTGVLCLRARASELEGDFAYGCVRQLLEPIVAQQSGSGDLFDGAAALAKPLFEPTRVARRAASADGAFSMLHGLYWLLNNLVAGGPALLSVDDLHWSDAESLQFLSYLAPRLDGLPLTVLASARSGEGDAAELARLAAAPETTVLALEPLSLEATAALCEDRLGRIVAIEFAAACREVTGGNPFLLGALLREASEQRLSADAREAPRVKRVGPAAVAQSVLLRLSGTTPSATALVRALAVLGACARLGELACLAEVEEDDAARAGDLLARVGILKPIERFDSSGHRGPRLVG
jgi:predicted ATPase